MELTSYLDVGVIWVQDASYRDLLIIPMSFVASEQAFSAGKRVVDDIRKNLIEEMVKCCVCL